MEIITFAIQKGGTGKSSCATALVGGLHKREKKVAIIDLDSQGNATTCMGVKKIKYSLYDCIAQGISFEEAVIKTPFGDVLGGNASMSVLEEELFTNKYGTTNKYKLLRNFINNQIMSEKYDYLIIDTPPNLGNLVTLALMATDQVIIPITSDELSIDGILQFYKIFKNTKEDNPKLDLLGFLFNMTDTRTVEYKTSKEDLEAIFGNKVFNFTIPNDQKVVKSHRYKNFKDDMAKPVTIAFPSCKASLAFDPLIDLILEGGC